MSEYITSAFEVRSDSDYDDFYVISKEEVAEQLRNAEIFVDAVQEYLLRQYDADDGNRPPSEDATLMQA